MTKEFSFPLKKLLLTAFLIAGMLLPALSGHAQDTVTVKDSAVTDSLVIIPHSVHKATVLSAVLPGAGQVYNHKIWKVPIIYAAFAGMAYLIRFNNQRYHTYNSALIARLDTDPGTVDNVYQNKYTDENLRSLTDYYHRNRDFSIVITALIYALNVIDAHVDAHLYSFDVSDDLTLNIQPAFQEYYSSGSLKTTSGIQLTLNF